MTLYPINTGNFKLDGGAMFGVVPKKLWQRTNPSDSQNMVDLTMRSLLIEDGNKLTLIDTGIGNKQDDKFFSYYHLWGDDSLDNSLAQYGFHRDDITDVLLTHLHFDHCGGAVQWNANKTGYEPAFKNATYWTNQKHWQWAIHPNDREKASFLTENLIPLEESGQLSFLDISQNKITGTGLGFSVHCVDGHTEKQMIPYLDYRGKKMVFAADLLPTVGHIPIPYIPSYDTRPLLTLQEKKDFLNQCVQEDIYIFLEHDAHHQICTLKETKKGIKLNKTYTFDEIFN